jgi:hypothetical protein
MNRRTDSGTDAPTRRSGIEQRSGFRFVRLEERIAPSANLNPGHNNTNNPGNEPPDGGSGNPGNNNPGENNTNNPGNETP